MVKNLNNRKGKEQKNLIANLINFYEKKGLKKIDIKAILEDAFVRAFEKDKEASLSPTIPHANVSANIDLDSVELKLQIKYKVVEHVKPENRFIEIAIDDPLLKDHTLKIGDTFIHEITTQSISFGKLQYIKQLFIQRVKEYEKKIFYDLFIKEKGKLIFAKIVQIEKKYALLKKDGATLFFPRSEMISTETLEVGQQLKVLVLEVEKNTKKIQIVVSRKNPQFIVKLLEANNEDLLDGIIKIKGIAREAGFKTKVAVFSELKDVDPVSALVGYKGQKIKSIISELNGERIDVVNYSENLVEFIANAVIPGRICGILFKDEKIADSQIKQATIIVAENEFLPTIGKRGINIKLASILTKVRLDIVKKSEAIEQKITYIAYHYHRQNHPGRKDKQGLNTINLDEFITVDEFINSLENDDDDKFEVEK